LKQLEFEPIIEKRTEIVYAIQHQWKYSFFSEIGCKLALFINVESHTGIRFISKSVTLN